MESVPDDEQQCKVKCFEEDRLKTFIENESCHKLWKNKQKHLLWSHFWINLRGTSYCQYIWIAMFANTSNKLLS